MARGVGPMMNVVAALWLPCAARMRLDRRILTYHLSHAEKKVCKISLLTLSGGRKDRDRQGH